MNDLYALAELDFCYLTTTGRVSGRPHMIEIWFVIEGRSLYMLAGGGTKSDWVKNLMQTPQASVKIGEQGVAVRGRLVTDPVEDALVRRLVVDKYQPRDSDDLTNWGLTALAVALDLES